MALNRRLRLGIVGLGRMGMRHWRTWQRLGSVDLVAVCDPHPAIQLWAKEQQLPCFTDVEQLIDKIDIAVVASPSSTHHRCALTLLSHGIACLVEKPLALSGEECRQLIQCARQHAVLLGVGHSERFNPGVSQALRELKHSTTALEVFRHASHAAPADSDVIDDLLVHDLDWLLQAGHQLSAVEVVASTQVAGQLQAITCQLAFAGGLEVSLSASYNRERRREVICSPRSADICVTLDWQPRPDQADPLTLQAQAFLVALQGRPSGMATAEQALEVMLLCERLRQLAHDQTIDRVYCHA